MLSTIVTQHTRMGIIYHHCQHEDKKEFKKWYDTFRDKWKCSKVEMLTQVTIVSTGE